MRVHIELFISFASTFTVSRFMIENASTKTIGSDAHMHTCTHVHMHMNTKRIVFIKMICHFSIYVYY